MAKLEAAADAPNFTAAFDMAVVKAKPMLKQAERSPLSRQKSNPRLKPVLTKIRKEGASDTGDAPRSRTPPANEDNTRPKIMKTKLPTTRNPRVVANIPGSSTNDGIRVPKIAIVPMTIALPRDRPSAATPRPKNKLPPPKPNPNRRASMIVDNEHIL